MGDQPYASCQMLRVEHALGSYALSIVHRKAAASIIVTSGAEAELRFYDGSKRRGIFGEVRRSLGQGTGNLYQPSEAYS